jgi:translation initiation factor eIF-2B subunit delta
MLNAFKDAIEEYTTPGGTSLARHMTSHYLSPQIDYLKSCRPISESMGNAIRWLKKLIVEVDPSTPEHEAKEFLCDSIDRFIQERIMVADQVIAASASKQIKNGSVVLTYAKSSIVEKTILRAHANGTKFRVVCVDSRPLFEGKMLATSLMHAGLQVDYLPFSGIAHAIADATVVLLGAHSMLSNGRLQSRIGTASVAMAAHRADIPVIVCCESVKFSGKVALDSIVLNEVAPAEELLLPSISTAPSSGSTLAAVEDDEGVQIKSLSDWKEIPNLQILNLMYDVTPAEYIRMVICEFGSVPPSSVPVVHRMANEGE